MGTSPSKARPRSVSQQVPDRRARTATAGSSRRGRPPRAHSSARRREELRDEATEGRGRRGRAPRDDALGTTTAAAAVGTGHEVDVLERLHGRGCDTSPVVARRSSPPDRLRARRRYSRAYAWAPRLRRRHRADQADAPIRPRRAYGRTSAASRSSQEPSSRPAVLADVVRTRVYLTDAEAFDGFAKAHGESFSDVRPAKRRWSWRRCSIPRGLLEIEVEAVVTATA